MRYTQEEIDRLVPEGFIRLTPNGMVRDSSLEVAQALLTTRRKLEIAVEALRVVGYSMRMTTSFDKLQDTAIEALNAINTEAK